MGFIDKIAQVASLGQNINKVSDEKKDQDSGVVGDLMDKMTIDMKDDDLIALSKQWEDSWSKVYMGDNNSENGGLKARQEKCVNYWRGKNKSETEMNTGLKADDENVDNLIFEAVETFLPIAAKNNPEPLVSCDNTEEGQLLASTIQKVLVYQSGMNRLNMKLEIKKCIRNWTLKFVGAVQMGWSGVEDDIDMEVVKPEQLILDPDGCIKRGEYIGEFFGRVKRSTASDLIKRFPKKEKEIREKCDDKLGTKINYKEFWTDDYVFWKLNDDVILAKVRNPHWNYDEEVKEPIMTIDENGNEIEDRTEDGEVITKTVKVPGANHFKHPKKPIILLVIFNLGDKPYDETSLIEQNIPNQDKISKRGKQIDQNIDNINSGWVVSGSGGFNEAQADRAVEAIKKGGTVFVPKGAPKDAIDKIQGSGLPADVYNERSDARNELRNIFGISGSQPTGMQQEKTVRGKIMMKQSDTDRIGGGITETVELFASKIYDYMIQMMYVYYDEERSFPILGKDGTQDWIILSADNINKAVTVTVKEGSLIPKDSLTKSSLAVDLWGAGALDPLSLYEMLELPNPKEQVKKLIQWNENPMSLIGEAPEEVTEDEINQGTPIPGAPIQ